MEQASLVAGLTWYAGSVLPFASLWHTVLRVAALNALRPRELPYSAAYVGTTPLTQFRAVDLLFNEAEACRGDAVSTSTMAQWLGEREEVFAWAHLGGLPRDNRFVLQASPRLCPQCIALGYHSALFSVRLLEACPIHGCELQSACSCGRPLDARMTTAMLARTGNCPCGKVALMTPGTCRRPTMPKQDAELLGPVADWLQRLSRVGMPRVHANSVNSDIDARWLAHVRDWCDVHELGYPACFVDHPRQPGLRIVTTIGAVAKPSPAADRRRARQRPTDAVDWPGEGNYWYENPATAAYRGMLRYLRRHVTRGADRFANEFLGKPDPLRMARTMREFPVAKLAFAEMIWCLRLEPNVAWRRWPYRPIAQRPDGDRICRIDVALASPSLDGQGNLVWPMYSWSEYQACRSMMLSHWREAQRLANDAVRTGIADWRPAPVEDDCRWSTAAVDGGIRFVSMEAQAAQDWALPLPDKARRKALYGERCVRRLQDIKDACSGPCLTRRGNGEWHVVESLPLARGRADRHRLLGVGSERPKFWLYEAAHGYVARACNVKVQAHADSPKEAIESLRQAMSRYQRSYRTDRALLEAQPYVSPEPVRDRDFKDYERTIYWIGQDLGFRRGAEFFWNAANVFLQRREQGAQSATVQVLSSRQRKPTGPVL